MSEPAAASFVTPKSIEQRLYEAFRENRGMLLSREEVEDLCFDDAIGTRIANHACIEAGVPESGQSVPFTDRSLPTWREMVQKYRDSEG